MVADHFRQAPMPSHLPSLPQVLSEETAQPPFLSATSFGTFEQVPGADASEQVLHTPVQALLQHTPSEQNVDLHSDGSVQEAPSSFLPHKPLMHLLAPEHWASPLHDE